MKRLLSIFVFLVGCQGPSGPPPVEAKPVKVVEDCAALCSEIRESAAPAPRSSARKAGEACLCFEPLGPVGAGRPAAKPAEARKDKKSKRKKRDRR